MSGPDGLLVVDKPAEWTSHDVVAKLRGILGTRRVGHAGTLDPMATGVLLVGVGRTTRLLGHLSGADKEYDGTVRLGARTATDDATGEVVATADASAVTDAELARAVAALTGEIEQVPPAVSAVKVAGVRAYRLARAGRDVDLAARRVVVHRFDVIGRRGDDVDVRVVCSSGTYIRALARDLGESLGVGAHLAALRRTRVGRFGVDRARTLADLAQGAMLIPLSDVVADAFPRYDVDVEAAEALRHGRWLPPADLPAGPVGAFGPDGVVVALVEERDGAVRPTCVFG